MTLYVDYFFLAHDGYSGRPHIDIDLLGVGLTGALLADLVTAGRAVIRPGAVQVRDVGSAGMSSAATTVLDRMRHHDLPLDQWLDMVAGSLYATVGEELVHTGLASRSPARRLSALTRPTTRYLPTDAVTAAAPRVLLRHAASTGPRDQRTIALAALALATGLEGVVADSANRLVRDRLRVMAEDISGALLAIVAGVNAAAMRIALTPRRGQ